MHVMVKDQLSAGCANEERKEGREKLYFIHSFIERERVLNAVFQKLCQADWNHFCWLKSQEHSLGSIQHRHQDTSFSELRLVRKDPREACLDEAT